MLMFKIIMVTLLVRRRSSSIVVSKVDDGAGEGVVADHAVQGHLMMRMICYHMFDNGDGHDGNHDDDGGK